MLNLKKYRELKGLTQTAVAKDLGISRQTYNNYELGKREADYEMLLKLAEYFDTTVENLLNKENMVKKQDNNSIELKDVYLSLLKDAQNEGINPDDIRLAIETIKAMRKKGEQEEIYINKEQLYFQISLIREQLLQNGLTYPLDIFEICEKFDKIKIAAIPFQTYGLRGMAKSADETSDISCILVNSFLSQPEQNFHGTHEFMHINFEDGKTGTTFRCYDRVMPFQDRYTEWIANEGAAELLIPYKEFIPFFCTLLNMYRSNHSSWLKNNGNYDIYDILARKYNVTRTVISNRVSTLSYEIDQYSNGIAIDDIKLLSHGKQCNNKIKVTDYVGEIQTLSTMYAVSFDWDNVISAE